MWAEQEQAGRASGRILDGAWNVFVFLKAAPSPYLLLQSNSGTVHTMNLTHVWLIMCPWIINCSDTHTTICQKEKKQIVIFFWIKQWVISAEWGEIWKKRGAEWLWAGRKASYVSSSHILRTEPNYRGIKMKGKILFIYKPIYNFNNRITKPLYRFIVSPTTIVIVAWRFSNWLCCASLRCACCQTN